MAQGLYTPLQLTAISGMLANQGLNPLPTTLTTALTAFNGTTVISDLLYAIATYINKTYFDRDTLSQLLNIGNSTCPALGNSIPVYPVGQFPNLNYALLTDGSTIGPYGFSGLIYQTGEAYLGDGDYSKFAQGFTAIQGYLGTTNQLINSSVNAQTYLGPTFSNMDALVTNNISNINSNFTGFGVDLANQGQLTSFSDINLYGTPAGLLLQIARVANLQGGTLQSVENQLLAAGLTKINIKTLINQGPTVTENEFNQYQRLAYTGMTRVTGAELQTVLDILDITTPNIRTMADLLDQQKIFPNSWRTMNTPSPAGPIPVYLSNGSVNMSIATTVNNYLPTASGCEDLGKVIPPGLAIANKAVQTSLQQITGLPNSTLPRLAEAVLGTTTNAWNINRTYLANAVVSNGSPIPTFYRAQQNVPVGININDTDYWLPTTLGGLNTMSGLPAIQAQTTPLASSVSTYYSTSVATGTGPNGTITTCDVIGLAIDHSNVAAQLNTATTAINTLDGLGALNTLKTIYVNMLSAPNDPAMLVLIGNANTEIANIVAAQPSLTTTLNTAFDAIATTLSQEKTYQTSAGVNYFELQANLQTSIFSFVKNLSQYGRQTESCGPAQFLNELADTSTLSGQAIVGCMREGQNTARLDATQLGLNTTPSIAPPITPIPAVTPVN